MRRDIVWEWLDRPGLEHLSLTDGRPGIAIESLVVVDLGDGAVRLRYAIACDDAWRFRHAALTLSAGCRNDALVIARDDGGAWTVDGEERADLAGCTEIDIMATPFTNTLPIRRLRFGVGEPAAVRMAYVALPDLSVRPVDQEYTCLDDATPPRRFRYRNIASGFTADLALDADGIVIDYPTVWSRRFG